MTAPAAQGSAASVVPARRTLPPAIRGIRAAFVFFTRIPVGGFPYRSADWKWAAAHAPVVGVAVGFVTGVVDRVLSPVGELPAAVLAIAVSMLLTGAFHEDGLADTSDALGGASNRESVFVILKDSRVGTFGAAALVVSIVARAALVAGLGPRALAGVTVAFGVARVAPIWLLASLPYVSDGADSKSGSVVQGRWPQAFTATIWMAVVLFGATLRHVITPAGAFSLTGAMALVGIITGYRYVRRVGCITGDFLGATEQVCEIAALVVMSVASPA